MSLTHELLADTLRYVSLSTVKTCARRQTSLLQMAEEPGLLQGLAAWLGPEGFLNVLSILVVLAERFPVLLCIPVNETVEAIITQ